MSNFMSSFIHKNKRFLIIPCGPLHTPHNCKNWQNWQNTMPRTVRLWPVHGAKASGITWIMHLSDLIRELIKKRCYSPKGVPAEEILLHMQNKEIGNVYMVQGSIIGKSYHITTIKDPNYGMLMMTTYGTLENLDGSETQQRYKLSGGELLTKQFNYYEVFGNHFN